MIDNIIKCYSNCVIGILKNPKMLLGAFFYSQKSDDRVIALQRKSELLQEENAKLKNEVRHDQRGLL